MLRLFGTGRALEAGQVEHGRDQVDLAGEGMAHPARGAAGQAHDEGDAVGVGNASHTDLSVSI
jgi:hypothetical protein